MRKWHKNITKCPQKMRTNCDVKLIQLNLLWRDNWILFSHLIGTDCSFAPSNPTTAPRTSRPTRTRLYYGFYIVCAIRIFKNCCQQFPRTLAPFSPIYSRKWPNIATGPKKCRMPWRFCPLDRFPFRFGNDLRWMLDVRLNKKNDSILNDFLHSVFWVNMAHVWS